MKTLLSRQSALSNPERQIEMLNNYSPKVRSLPKFQSKLAQSGLLPLRATGIETLQINLGKLCNQVCEHCHVDAGPDRTEMMTRETMEECLTVLRSNAISTVDLTGGAPEMNPHFRWFVQEIRKLDRHLIVRCNLTILMAGKQYEDLAQLFSEQSVHVISSLPCYGEKNTDRQRGVGVFEKSIAALQRLNGVGYGQQGSSLILDLVYNPVGAFLPGSQSDLEADYRRELRSHYGVEFNHLIAITNLPISRFLDALIENGNFEDYLDLLLNSFNPTTASNVMCRSLLSVSWDGFLYDCDFNQMLDVKVTTVGSRHIKDFSAESLSRRSIATNQHCFGCTAGSGSSCSGSLS